MSKPFLFFDFDGVLFDTLDEAFVVSSMAWENSARPEDIKCSGDRYGYFKKYRHLCGPAADFYYLFKSFENNLILNKEIFDGLKVSLDPGLEIFIKKFYESRTELSANHRSFWEALNKPYPFLNQFKALAQLAKDQIYIVSTKDRPTIQSLLERYSVGIFQNHILGKEFYDKFKSKRKLIELVLDIASGSEGLFIDDGASYIKDVQSLPGIKTFQPSWGYVGPEDKTATFDEVVSAFTEAVKGEDGEKGYFGLEKNLWRILKELKALGAQGIKAEFEAEGSSFRDLVRLRRLTLAVGLPLFLKIGGVEAVRDIKDALELGVDGLIVPMVESAFGILKFKEAFLSIYKGHKIHLSFNLETKTAVDKLPEILTEAQGLFDNVTVGRTDLSHSFQSKSITPDSDTIFSIIEKVLPQVQEKKMTLTVGGSLSAKSLNLMGNRDIYGNQIQRVETRKVIFDVKQALIDERVLEKAINFEEAYILSKKEFQELFLESEVNRLTKLTRRV